VGIKLRGKIMKSKLKILNKFLYYFALLSFSLLSGIVNAFSDKVTNSYIKSLDDYFFYEATRNGISRIVTGAVIFHQDKVLIVKRVSNDFLGGIYEIPGGHVDINETIYGCLIREVKEETGLNVNNILGYLGFFDYESKNKKLTRQFNFVVSVKNVNSVRLNPAEHEDYKWISVKEINNYNLTPPVKKVIQNAYLFSQNLKLTNFNLN
jgi:8-oxo-dGTP diphosphatase